MCKKIRHKISYNDKITQTKGIKIPAKNNLGKKMPIGKSSKMF